MNSASGDTLIRIYKFIIEKKKYISTVDSINPMSPDLTDYRKRVPRDILKPLRWIKKIINNIKHDCYLNWIRIRNCPKFSGYIAWITGIRNKNNK